jgi:hypothetical protein
MKKIILFVIVLIIVGAGAFFGGMKYQQNKISSQRTSFQNLSPEQRQQFVQRAGRAGANFLSGEVISKDEKSLTLKLLDGSTKIVFFSGSTQISKATEGTVDDIEIGKQIFVSGDQNSDGSYTAKTIQLSPRYPTSNK